MKEILIVKFATDMEETAMVMRACRKEMEALARIPTVEARSEMDELASFVKKLGLQIFSKEDLQHIPEMNDE